MVFIVYSFVYSVTLLFCIKSVFFFFFIFRGRHTALSGFGYTVDVPGPKEEMNLDIS